MKIKRMSVARRRAHKILVTMLFISWRAQSLGLRGAVLVSACVSEAARYPKMFPELRTRKAPPCK